MEMEDHYGIPELRQLIGRAPAFPSPSPFPPHPQPLQQPQYDTLFIGGRHVLPDPPDLFNPPSHPRGGGSIGGLHPHSHPHPPHQQHLDQLNCDSTTSTAGGDGGSSRWPRQETLTLLEVRSRLHHKFKEANQKGPLWDDVSRIMWEEHGYQRSGKKCREKFENLYKYYKKTKEGKAGRQDGKHYRFFKQLEALYGSSSSSDNISQNTPLFPHSNSSDFDFDLDQDEPSMDSDGSKERKANHTRHWKAKMKDFIDLEMRKVMEKQEAWVHRMMKTLEGREQQRLAREEEWRARQEAARVERENRLWESERAWIQTRDSALIKALENITRDEWPEPEVARLVQLRTSMESRLQQCGFSEEVLWEDIAAKMAYFGYERGAIACKHKWDALNKPNSRKAKEDYTNYEAGLYMNQLSGFNNCEI